MISVVLADVFDTKIVDHEGEGNVAGVVFPKGGCASDGSVSGLGKMQLESVVCDNAGLFEAGHSFANFHVHTSVGGGKLAKVVLENDFFGEGGERKFHIFVSFHRCAIVKILDVHGHEFGAGGGQGAVEQNFGGGEAGTMGGGGARVIQFVAADGDTDAIDFSFVWSNCGNKAAIGDFSVGRNC